MDKNTSQPRPPATIRQRRTWTRIVVALGILALSTSAAAQVKQDGRRLTPGQAFETVWVIDRDMPEFDVWRTLTHVTSSDGFQPVVLHGGDNERRTASLEHLLWLLPQGDSVWVSEAETAFNVDGWTTPDRVADLDPSTGPLVFSAGKFVDPIAALIAMRLDGVLTADVSAAAVRSVAVGIAGPRMQTDRFDVFLPTCAAALAYVNQLAERNVVMVVRRGGLLAEHVLWAFQRDAKILEVDPPPYAIDDAWSEFAAVGEVSRQIHAGVAELLGADLPEAMVIAGDWDEIPFRFPDGLGGAEATPPPAGAPFQCNHCDNGVYEYAADLAYANLDEDPAGIPDVPVGRLMTRSGISWPSKRSSGSGASTAPSPRRPTVSSSASWGPPIRIIAAPCSTPGVRHSPGGRGPPSARQRPNRTITSTGTRFSAPPIGQRSSWRTATATPISSAPMEAPLTRPFPGSTSARESARASPRSGSCTPAAPASPIGMIMSPATPCSSGSRAGSPPDL